MYRMSIMTFLLEGKEGLDRTKCLEMGKYACQVGQKLNLKQKNIIYFTALVHDLAESLVGDITPYCGISKEEKKKKEMDAMQEIANLIEPRGKRLMELFLVSGML